MKTPEGIRIFETQNVDLATFLMVEGIKLHDCKRSDRNKNIIILQFLDEKENCLDLERVYLNSDYKKFRDTNKYLLSKIHQLLKD